MFQAKIFSTVLCDVQDVVAIKIFTDPAGFANEERAYGVLAVAEVAGPTPTFSKNEDCSMMMPNGLPFPPYTVAGKGKPLDVLTQDPNSCMQVRLLHACIMFQNMFCMYTSLLFDPC